jgi:hypothetical protein
MKQVKDIQRIWAYTTSNSKGYFCRHIDGNKLNNDVNNLAWVHPCEAFQNPNWTVDWDMGLSKKQIQFVKNNLRNFIEIYS